MAPRYKYSVRVIEGQVIDGQATERLVYTDYTTATSSKQAVNNVKHKNKIRTDEESINGFGDYRYTRLCAEKED